MSSAPKTRSASTDLSGVHLSVTDMIARITPSWSRSAMSWPGSILPAKASVTSRVIGIGQSVPSASRISLHDAGRSRPRSRKPLSGLKPPFIRSSRSQIWRGVRSQEGRSPASILSFAALSAET